MPNECSECYDFGDDYFFKNRLKKWELGAKHPEITLCSLCRRMVWCWRQLGKPGIYWCNPCSGLPDTMDYTPTR